MNGVSVFFPLRAGSTRVIEKNTRPFTPEGLSLFEHKLVQLAGMAEAVQEIVVSTNDAAVMAQFEAFQAARPAVKMRLVVRPDALCRSETRLQDLIDYTPTVVEGEHIFWIHATSPFMGAAEYLDALALYLRGQATGESDSLMSVNRVQQFFWDDAEKRIANADCAVERWPRTQDLAPLYEINHALYVSSVANYTRLRDRIGVNPALYLTEGLGRIDIDWQEDFDIAQALFPLYARAAVPAAADTVPDPALAAGELR